MTTITLEVPDELAARIRTLGEDLTDLLFSALESHPTDKTALALKMAATHPVYREMMDFLASSPTPQQIAAFKVSPPAQERLEELLERNRESSLTDEEEVELDVYELVEHSMIRLKAQARSRESVLK
jgi:hypothetical protein